MAPASGAPQLAQYLPVAAAPHTGQAVVGSDEEGDVMRVKIVGRSPSCITAQSGINYEVKTTCQGLSEAQVRAAGVRCLSTPAATNYASHGPQQVVFSCS